MTEAAETAAATHKSCSGEAVHVIASGLEIHFLEACRQVVGSRASAAAAAGTPGSIRLARLGSIVGRPRFPLRTVGTKVIIAVRTIAIIAVVAIVFVAVGAIVDITVVISSGIRVFVVGVMAITFY